MSSIFLKATSHIKGEVSVPGSKSISNRALLLCALSQNYTILSNLLVSDDTLWMLRALVSLGIKMYDLNPKFLSTNSKFKFTDIEQACFHSQTELELEQVLNNYQIEPITTKYLDKLQQLLASNLTKQQNLTLSDLPCAITILVKGNQGLFNFNGDLDLYLGNAGTAFRPLLATLSLSPSNSCIRISGEPRMHERPLLDLILALEQLDACIECEQNYGYAPLIIYTGQKKLDKLNLSYNSYSHNTNNQKSSSKNTCCNNLKTDQLSSNMPVVEIDCQMSSQYLTALLLIAPLLPLGLQIRVKGKLISKPYIHLTIVMMKQFGIEVKNIDFNTFIVYPQVYNSGLSICNNQTLNSSQSSLSHSNQKLVGSYRIESDASSASYFFIAGALAGQVSVKHINAYNTQGDIKLLQILKKLGAKVSYHPNSITVSRNEQLLETTGYGFTNFNIDCNDIPDAAMGLAIIGLFTPPGMDNVLYNIGSWKVKETNRIVAIAQELTKLGAKVSYTDDSITIGAPKSLNRTSIDTYNDHRMAMCFALVSLNQQNIDITINNPNCVNKTFPQFFNVFRHLTNN